MSKSRSQTNFIPPNKGQEAEFEAQALTEVLLIDEARRLGPVGFSVLLDAVHARVEVRPDTVASAFRHLYGDGKLHWVDGPGGTIAITEAVAA